MSLLSNKFKVRYVFDSIYCSTIDLLQSHINNMYLLIVLLPLLSFLVASLFGRFIGRIGSTIITTSLIFLTAFLSTVAFYEVALAEANCYINLVL